MIPQSSNAGSIQHRSALSAILSSHLLSSKTAFTDRIGLFRARFSIVASRMDEVDVAEASSANEVSCESIQVGSDPILAAMLFESLSQYYSEFCESNCSCA
jgi:hypothetical protein